jgi:general secretion pathway protein H
MRKNRKMATSSDIQRAWTIWWASSLLMVACPDAAGSAEPPPANPAVSYDAKIAPSSGPGISVCTGDPLNEATFEVHAPLIRYLIRELIALRLVNAQLSPDRETGGLAIELAQGGAQLADATAAPAEMTPRLKERGRPARQARGRARGQLAAKKDPKPELDHQLAGAYSETEDMRRLDATYRPQPPVMPLLKPRLRAGEGDALAPASDTASEGAWPGADTVASIEGDGSIKTISLDGAISDWPRTDPTDSRARLNEAAARLASGLRGVRDEAKSQGQERVFTLDVEERAFATGSTAELVPLDPALSIYFLTLKSERIGQSRAGIRFFADGSSTGGRVELKLLGNQAAINVQWATGAVTVER